MLLEIAIIFATSVAGLSATEANIVPAAPSVPSVASADSQPPFVGPVLELDAGVTGGSGVVAGSLTSRVLSSLASIPSAEMSSYLSARPGIVDQILAEPPRAQTVALWWSSLDETQQQALGSASPKLLGNLEGVPYTVRDISNRTALNQSISHLEVLLESNAGRAVAQSARQQLAMLNSISDTLVDGDSTRPERTLITLDVDDQGRAAIVLGDLAEADYVSFLVPGMFFTIENQMPYWVEAAHNLYNQQRDWLDRFDEQSVFSQNQSVATVAWIGYHTPNLTNVGAIDNANQGRDFLAQALLGLHELRGDDQPYTSIIAHSYGSTAAMMALSEYDFSVDALAMVGSPGSPAQSVAELNVRDNNVFVGEAAWDPIPNSSYFGSDPGARSFGAQSMGVSGSFDILTKEKLVGSVGHNEYFTPGSEAMRNFALISIGRGELVIPENAPATARASARSVAHQSCCATVQ